MRFREREDDNLWVKILGKIRQSSSSLHLCELVSISGQVAIGSC